MGWNKKDQLTDTIYSIGTDKDITGSFGTVFELHLNCIAEPFYHSGKSFAPLDRDLVEKPFSETQPVRSNNAMFRDTLYHLSPKLKVNPDLYV